MPGVFNRAFKILTRLGADGFNLHRTGDVVDEPDKNKNIDNAENNRGIDRHVRDEGFAITVVSGLDGAQHQQGINKRCGENPQHNLVIAVAHKIAHQTRAIRRRRSTDYRNGDGKGRARHTQERGDGRKQRTRTVGTRGEQQIMQETRQLIVNVVQADEHLRKNNGGHDKQSRDEPELFRDRAYKCQYFTHSSRPFLWLLSGLFFPCLAVHFRR